jgi:hypothetical protein
MLLVLPTFDRETRPLIRAALRAVQCAQTDPVSFALLAGEPHADFPSILGLSARHGALRAAICQRAWLQAREKTSRGERHGESGMLLCCARTAVFLGSDLDGDPELPLTIPAIVEGLSARRPSARTAVETVADEYLGGSTAAGSDAGPALAAVLAECLAASERDPAPRI